MSFLYDSVARRYRVAKTGRFVRADTVVKAKDQIIFRSAERMDVLAQRLASGRLSLEDWRLAMRAEIKATSIEQYLLGRGGRNAMTQSDWGKIGADLRKQYQYLNRFASEIEAGTLSEKQIAARARQYAAGTNANYGRGQASAWNVSLPAYPGDGSTECMNYCKCSWVIIETETEILARWTLGSSTDRCSECSRRSRAWAPIRFDRETGMRIQEVA